MDTRRVIGLMQLESITIVRRVTVDYPMLVVSVVVCLLDIMYGKGSLKLDTISDDG